MTRLHKITTVCAIALMAATVSLSAQTTARGSSTATRSSSSSSARGTTIRAAQSGAKTTTNGSAQSGRATVDRRETTVSNSNVTNKGLTTVRTTPVRSGSSTTSTTSRQSGSSSSSSSSGSATVRQSGGSTATTVRQSGGGTGTTTSQQGGGTTSTTNRSQGQSGAAVRTNPNVTTRSRDNGRPERTDTYTDRGGNYRYGGAGHMNVQGDGRDVMRIPPMERPPIPYTSPAMFNAKRPHYYGYNIITMPHGYVTKTYWGKVYYSYNGIWYTKVDSYYRVCRPPFGTTVRFGLCKKGLTSVHFSYYNSIERTYSAINENYAIIAEQNRIIAQNNAIIAAQNARLALNATNAQLAYMTASQLGLVQSFASATTQYYYQDGVFYTGSGRNFTTIIPPAGAIVASLPEDYIIVKYGNDPYYRVENTLYRQFVVDGAPYFEVLGQFPY